MFSQKLMLNRRNVLQWGTTAALSGFVSISHGAESASVPSSDPEMSALNRRALEECGIPVRPGIPGKVPFWNGYAHSFLYVPAFEFHEVDKAVSYLADVQNVVTKETFQSTMEKPWLPIRELWQKISPGTWSLTITGKDASGKSAGLAGKRTFVRRPSFQGPYPQPKQSFRESALLALRNVFQLPYVKKMAEMKDAPPKIYNHFCYPSKMLSAIIIAMCEYAKLSKEDSQTALQYAQTAADILIRTSVPSDKRLTSLPKTYRGNFAAAKGREHLIMMNYPLDVALAFLKVAEGTNNATYKDKAREILDRYLALQEEDGSWFLLYDWTTGKSVGSNKLLAYGFLYLADYFIQQGDTKYVVPREKCLKNFIEGRIKTYDWSGQFEDVAPAPPYKNQEKYCAGLVAEYLLCHSELVPDAVKTAESLIRFMEDQFVLWGTVDVPDSLKKELLFHYIKKGQFYPLAQEQYAYMRPINASACDAIFGFMAMYNQTKDPLWKAKAESLGYAMVTTQFPDGELPTYWDMPKIRGTWINCQIGSALALLKLDDPTANVSRL